MIKGKVTLHVDKAKVDVPCVASRGPHTIAVCKCLITWWNEKKAGKVRCFLLRLSEFLYHMFKCSLNEEVKFE